MASTQRQRKIISFAPPAGIEVLNARTSQVRFEKELPPDAGVYVMLQLRPAQPHDVSILLDLIRELAAYEREPDAVLATEADLLRDGFGDNPKFQVILADKDHQTVGFSLYFFSYSTWEGRGCLFLEDLFVRPAFRGLGIGKAMLIFLARIAQKEECRRFQWHVLDWNELAIGFYQTLGARLLPEWRIVRLDHAAINTLAVQDSA